MFDADFALRLLGMRIKDRAFIGPETVQIDLTDKCTSNCLGCWARSPFLRDDDHYDTLERGTLDKEFVFNLLPELAGIGVKTIFLGGGGDPLCHPDFIEIVGEIKKIGFSCTVNTNLMTANARMIETAVNVGLDELIVSLWAADSLMYSKLHPNQSEGTFLHIENKLKYAADLKNRLGKKAPKIKIYNVICSLNVNDISKMIDHGKSLGVDEIEFSIFDPIPRRTHIFLLTPKQIDNVTKFFEVYKQQSGLFVHYELFLRRLRNVDVSKGVYDNGIVESIPCAAGWFYARVTTVGQVHSCLKAHRIAAGDLAVHRFGQIWFGEGQDRFRKNTVQLNYDNPFLEMIGHDIDFDLPGCYRICDNLGYNQNVMRTMGALTPVEQECLAAMEKAVKDHATIDRLRIIHADFAARGQRENGPAPETINAPNTDGVTVRADHPILEKADDGDFDRLKKKLRTQGDDGRINIPVTIKNFARLPEIFQLISDNTGRKLDKEMARFEFSPIADAQNRARPFLQNLTEKVKEKAVFLSVDFEQITNVLKSFSQGSAKHSQADLLRALGVVTNKALIGPRTFHLDVANGCNTNCIYCWFHSPFSVNRADAEKIDANWARQLMPWPMFERLVDDLAEVGCKEDVVLSGKGEPLIHPKINEMVRYLKKRDIFTTLFTNGLLLDKQVARSCIDSGVDLLYVSISAATSETFSLLQTKPPAEAFDKIIGNIKELIRMRNSAKATLPKVVLVDVLCNRNQHEVEAFATLAASLGADHLRYQLAAIEPYNRELALKDEELLVLGQSIERAKTIARNSGIEIIANIDAQLSGKSGDWSGENYLNSGCLAGWAFARAWVDGTLSFCCSPKPIGNLDNMNFAKWWYSKKYDTYRLAGKYISQNSQMQFEDDTPLWNDICRRCPNYEGIGHLEEILDDLGV